jgi:hypothetical protein
MIDECGLRWGQVKSDKVKINPEINFGTDQKGTVVIASTTKNQVLAMALGEYERFKSKQLMSYKDHM